MPRYDYQCPKCKEIKEEVHRMDEKPTYICEKCGEEKVKLLPKGTTFHFPGIVGRWMDANYTKYRAGTLTHHDEQNVTEPEMTGAGKDFNSR